MDRLQHLDGRKQILVWPTNIYLKAVQFWPLLEVRNGREVTFMSTAFCKGKWKVRYNIDGIFVFI